MTIKYYVKYNVRNTENYGTEKSRLELAEAILKYTKIGNLKLFSGSKNEGRSLERESNAILLKQGTSPMKIIGALKKKGYKKIAYEVEDISRFNAKPSSKAKNWERNQPLPEDPKWAREQKMTPNNTTLDWAAKKGKPSKEQSYSRY